MQRAFPVPSDQWLSALIVPGYSDGLAPEFHRLPAERKLLQLAMNRGFQIGIVRSQAANAPFQPSETSPLTEDRRDSLHRRWSASE